MFLATCIPQAYGPQVFAYTAKQALCHPSRGSPSRQQSSHGFSAFPQTLMIDTSPFQFSIQLGILKLGASRRGAETNHAKERPVQLLLYIRRPGVRRRQAPQDCPHTQWRKTCPHPCVPRRGRNTHWKSGQQPTRGSALLADLLREVHSPREAHGQYL